MSTGGLDRHDVSPCNILICHPVSSSSIIILALITIIVAVSCFILCTEDNDELMQPTTINLAKLYSGGSNRANDPTGSTPPNLG